jgi:multidrug efflux pump subunit AcrA (membrane-fusion protein)
LRIGDSVAVEVSGLDKTFPGKIARFSDRIDTGTRTMRTEVDVPNPRYQLVPGMYATLRLPLEVARAVLALPVQAIQILSGDRGIVLLVAPGNELEKREIQLGVRTATDVEVVAGLQENDEVIFGQQSQYKPGQQVVPKLIVPAQAE